MNSDREALKFDFLKLCNLGNIQRIPLKGDASYRRYERILSPSASYIFMDAPPEHEEVVSFIKVSNFLIHNGFSAPHILNQDIENGFLLLEDFGDNIFNRILSGSNSVNNNISFDENELYSCAIDNLIHLHKIEPKEINLANYDELTLLKESLRFIDWYVEILNGEKISSNLRDEFIVILKHLLSSCKIRNDVVVLRDYHADNLIFLPEREGIKKAGLLDYQDAVIGSPLYDIISLLEDARRDVSSLVVESMINRYLRAFPDYSRKDFIADYSIYGIQRNLKILGFIAAQAVKHRNNFYLSLLPRVWRHINNDLKHPLLLPLKSWLMKIVPTQINKFK